MKTSYYAAAAKLDRKAFFLVRTSLGSPRFLKCDCSLPAMTPESEFLDLEEGSYKRKYVAMLNRIGVPAFKKHFQELKKAAKGREVVLLCFESLSAENVADGQFCHRRIFADWWKKQTGETIEEILAPSPKKKGKVSLQLALF